MGFAAAQIISAMSKSATNKEDVIYCDKCNYPITKEEKEAGKCKTCVEIAAEKANKERESLEQLAMALGGMKAVSDYTKERFINKEAFKYTADYPNCNLYIWGGYGVGKSHLGTSLLRDIYPNCRIYKTSSIMREMRSLENPSEETKYINKFTKYRGIMLDDIDKEKRTDYLCSTLYTIIEKLYMDNYKGLIITSNRNLESLADYLMDGAVSSRLHEMCRVIELGGRDIRKIR